MHHRWFRLASSALALSLFFAGTAPVLQAQDPPPPTTTPASTEPVPPPNPYPKTFATDHAQPAWRSSADTSPTLPTATGGPDAYGYTWDDGVPFNWIDASNGLNTGLQYGCEAMVAVPLGFNFKFYENTYSAVYVDFNGYLAFSNRQACASQGATQSPVPPNNVVAAYWSPFDDIPGRVRYLQGGTAPNRYLVVEWYQMPDSGGGSYTFEAILHENGDIVLQYLDMVYPTGNWWCGGIGLEDSVGLDGFNYSFCAETPDNKAVRFYRPPLAARVNLPRRDYGSFAQPGNRVSFPVQIHNTGELGADVYDLAITTTWPLSLYAADGITPLTDNDGDTVLDTGPVAQGSIITIVAQLQAPANAVVGNAVSTLLTARSSLNTAKSKTATLHAAIPTAFAQAYRNHDNNAMSLDLVLPGGQLTKRVTANHYYGYDMAIAEAPNGNLAYVWRRGRCLGNCSLYVDELEYTLVNRFGDTVRGVTKLADHSSATTYVNDTDPAIAVAPDGHVGVLWARYMYTSSNNGLHNINLYFAILDANGNLTAGPTNITGITAWTPWSATPHFSKPTMATTGDNRFALAWHREDYVNGCTVNDCFLNDIYYAMLDTAGNVVRPSTKFTNDTTGAIYEGYYEPNLVALSGNRALLTWYRDSNDDIYYAVFDSSGATVKAQTNLSNDGYTYFERLPDAAQLSDGKIMVAWWGSPAIGVSVIRYAVLDANYTLTIGPVSLNNPGGAATGSNFVSVAADAAGRGVLTWMDDSWSYRLNLYYALVNSAGNLVTPPMIFRSASQVETSYTSYGNTALSSFPTSVDGALQLNGTLFAGQPGVTVSIPLRYNNLGHLNIPTATLSAVLGSGLTYVGNSAGLSATVNGNQMTWALPSLNALHRQDFSLYVSLPATATIGTQYALALTLSVPGDVNPANNAFNGNVMIAEPFYLPLVWR